MRLLQIGAVVGSIGVLASVTAWWPLLLVAAAAVAFIALAAAGVWTTRLFGSDWAAVSRWSITLIGLGLAVMRMAPVANVLIVFGATPFITALLARLFLAESLHPHTLVTMAAAVAGLALVAQVLLAGAPTIYLAYGVGGPLLIWLFHWDNIGRLLRGEERRVDGR